MLACAGELTCDTCLIYNESHKIHTTVLQLEAKKQKKIVYKLLKFFLFLPFTQCDYHLLLLFKLNKFFSS